MNPHFIFNTLNSIQYFVLNNDKVSSSKFISKFSQLMRITLENSQSSLISLQADIESIKLYIELEQVRFKNKFEYDLQVGCDIETEIVTIPPLIIQPFVENAIWHGLMHLENKKQGRLSINFSLSDSLLVCQIEDNGIGREQAMKIKLQSKPQHKSLGTTITESRVSIINQIYKSNIRVTYNDLYDSDRKASGTRITIYFPLFSKA